MLSQATKLRVPILESRKTELITWFTQTKSRTYSDQLKQEMSLGVNVYEFFQGKLQKEGSFREEIKETFQRRVSELSQHIDRIAAAIQIATKKPVLVIIDDLDKLDREVVKTIFQDNIKALFSPNIRIVFTIPIAVVRDTRLLATLESESFAAIMLPVTKFFHREDAHKADGEPIEANVTILQDLLAKRIPDELIDPEAKRQIVLQSGGVLRELVRLAQECCGECLLELDLEPENAEVRINSAILTEAVKSLRNQFARPLGSHLYELLMATYQEFKPADAKSPEFLELLHGLYVLEYENDDLWYDLHPLVADLLRRQQLI